MTEQPPPTRTDVRLDSWKAIAAYLNRDARTVMRWEKSEGLPVHRHRHLARSSVFAYPDELDAWQAARLLDPATPRETPRGRVLQYLAVAGVFLGAIISGGGGHFEGPLAAMQRGSVDQPIGWPDNARSAMSAAMSPDGRYVSYIPADPETDLHVHDLQTGEDRRLTRIFGDGGFIDYSAISHDSTRVAFSSKDVNGKPVPAKLRVVPIDTSPDTVPRVLLEGPWTDPKEWSPDDSQLLVTVQRGDKRLGNDYDIGLVSVADGALRVLTHVPYPGPGYHVRMSPDATWVAYDVRAGDNVRQRDIRLVAVADAQDVVLLEGPSSDTVVGWSPDGRYLVFESDRGGTNGLWAAPVTGGALAGEPILLRADFNGDPVSMTADGSLMYEAAPDGRKTALYVASVDPTTGSVITPPWFASHDRQATSRSPRWSGDGQSLAYITSRPAGPVISIRSIATGLVREIPLNLGYIWTHEWSPDTRAFVFRATDLRGREGVFLVDAATGDVTTVALKEDRVVGYYQPHFSADSQKLYYFANLLGQSATLRLTQEIEYDIATGRPQALREWPAPANRGDFHFGIDRSPDRQWILRMQVTPRSAIYMENAETGEEREIFGVERPEALDGNNGIRWMPDGRALIVRVAGPGPNERTLWWIPIDGSAPHQVDVGRGDLVDTGFSIHPDGRQIAFVAGDPIVSKIAKLTSEYRLLKSFLPGR